MSARDAAWPLGTVTVLGAHILDVLARHAAGRGRPD
jgi:hypothetical protein